jgi:bifunctional aspartokinase / homoserine dehydrogenase 1
MNIFLVGTGLIGGTLLDQINAQANIIHVIALANSEHTLFDDSRIDLTDWQSALEESTDDTDMAKFVSKMKSLNLKNSIFVDCTASEETQNYYEEILNAKISIVTPNKKANSSSFETYQMLKNTAAKNSVKFLYETNVGAGLPVISTLNDLVKTGDKIIKIEAVLSGTLSYIFNVFTDKMPFSTVVQQAQKKGYTEPDPRDDLNGVDVARKILILARESGLSMEIDAIEIENLVPEAGREANSVEQFFVELKKADDKFAAMQNQAKCNNKKLRYIAKLEKGLATVSLQAIDKNHPFYDLSGSDNIVSFTTKRYKETPLVIKGPGAGAEVTAAGVFADILRTI